MTARHDDTWKIVSQIMGVPVVNDGLSEGELGILKTEEEFWDNTRLALLNAVLDTIVPGARLVVAYDDSIEDESKACSIYFSDCSNEMESRPRDVVSSLRDLAASIERMLTNPEGI